MASITFAPLKYPAQLATKTDIYRIERELVVLKWMTGIVLGGIVALIMKAFFPG
jgi:hypothetical protein